MLSVAEQSELVRRFWAAMLDHYDAVTCQKSHSELMALAAEALAVLGIQSKDTFLTNFVTTICTFSDVIYTPFEVGADLERWPAWSQIRVCCHECQHVVQAKREGWVKFDSLYLASSSFRAGFEAEAFGTDMEMECWADPAFDPLAFAQSRPAVLKSYGCSDADIEQAVAALTIRASMVKAGAVETDAAKTAIAWLEANVPELQEVTR